MIITTATVVATAIATEGMSIAAAAAVKVGAGLAGGMAQMAANELTKEVPYRETTQTMTIHEFKHKYLSSGERPISLRIEFSSELRNQYLNKRELKGQMLYSYANFSALGKALAQKGFFKASVIS